MRRNLLKTQTSNPKPATPNCQKLTKITYRTNKFVTKITFHPSEPLYLCGMSMKGNRLYSIFKGKCPVCHEGKVFTYNNYFHPSKFDKMEERCSCCGHKYEIETGFFYGAMYVNYALTVAISVAAFVLTYLIYPETPYWVYIIIILTALIGLAPITYRAGRLIWMNFFSGYKADAIEKHKQQAHG
jgi:uncharacterized protein (DUF983 family)